MTTEKTFCNSTVFFTGRDVIFTGNVKSAKIQTHFPVH